MERILFPKIDKKLQVQISFALMELNFFKFVISRQKRRFCLTLETFLYSIALLKRWYRLPLKNDFQHLLIEFSSGDFLLTEYQRLYLNRIHHSKYNESINFRNIIEWRCSSFQNKSDSYFLRYIPFHPPTLPIASQCSFARIPLLWRCVIYSSFLFTEIRKNQMMIDNVSGDYLSLWVFLDFFYSCKISPSIHN